MSARILAVALLGVVACKATSVDTYSVHYYHAPIRPYTTFFINPVSDTGASLTEFNRRWIVSMTRALMVKKGLTPGGATADLLVNIVSVDSSRTGWRQNDWYRLFQVDRPPLAYGALIIDIIDKDKRVLIWEGIANQAVDVPARDAEKRVSEVVVRLMEGFSPRGDPTGRAIPK